MTEDIYSHLLVNFEGEEYIVEKLVDIAIDRSNCTVKLHRYTQDVTIPFSNVPPILFYMKAVQDWDVELLKECIANYLENINDIVYHGNYTSLHMTAENGSTDLCQLLIDNGANPCLCNNDNQTALHRACKKGHFSVIAKLLGSKHFKPENFVNISDIHGETALFVLIHRWKTYCNSKNHFMNFICGCSVVLLLKNGANPNIKNTNDGMSCLHLSAQDGNLPALKLLFSSLSHYPIDPNDGDVDNDTPLHHLCFHRKSTEGIEFLLKMGADMGKKNDNNQWPHQLLDKSKKAQTIRKILKDWKLKEKRGEIIITSPQSPNLDSPNIDENIKKIYSSPISPQSPIFTPIHSPGLNSPHMYPQSDDLSQQAKTKRPPSIIVGGNY
eukprot:TRINITY_DN982_c0_g1_i1.p1 TRINITY_DN982_c0_g1~~TRINITY_DN982_c0_g1_i1.p1  ORF type:complete len:399 (-),score=95.67 TRINITY_DN982_c0_g1_i1:14-1162(-)